MDKLPVPIVKLIKYMKTQTQSNIIRYRSKIPKSRLNSRKRAYGRKTTDGRLNDFNTLIDVQSALIGSPPVPEKNGIKITPVAPAPSNSASQPTPTTSEKSVTLSELDNVVAQWGRTPKHRSADMRKYARSSSQKKTVRHWLQGSPVYDHSNRKYV